MKKAQMPAFNWIFALIIGAVILFLALVFSGKLIGTESYLSENELINSFNVLLNPFASVFGLSKTIDFPVNVKINLGCKDPTMSLPLGKNTVLLKSQSKKGEKWSEGVSRDIYDKYIFASEFDSKKFHVMSKSFELPFRIDELIYVITEDYCFINAPNRIKNEVQDLNITKIKFDTCEAENKRVCFETGASCDIKITGNSVRYVKEKKEVNFVTDSLMYAAIFGPEVYECNLKRLMKRLDLLCEIYIKRADRLITKGCNMRNIKTLMRDMRNEVQSAHPDLSLLDNLAQSIEGENSMLNCPVF